MDFQFLDLSALQELFHLCCIHINPYMTFYYPPHNVLDPYICIILLINCTKWWIIKVKHPSSDTYRKNISRTTINNIILVLRIHTVLSSSFVIYFFCICHSGSFPIIPVHQLTDLHKFSPSMG